MTLSLLMKAGSDKRPMATFFQEAGAPAAVAMELVRS